MNRRGSVLAAALFLTLAFGGALALFVGVAAVELDRQRAATACDFSLLSAMRVRRDSLETIATRWAAFGASLVAAGGTLTVDSAAWPAVSSEADALRRAISGYQGRVTSALTVALDANDLPRDAARAVTGSGLRLGVTARTEPVLVGAGTASLPGAWYARGWFPSDRAPTLSDAAVLDVAWPTRWRGAPATVSVRAAAVLEWDADPADPATAVAHGGFAPSLAEALAGGNFAPHRAPVFRTARSAP